MTQATLRSIGALFVWRLPFYATDDDRMRIGPHSNPCEGCYIGSGKPAAGWKFHLEGEVVMYRLSKSFDSRRIALAGLLAIGLSTSALAAGPSHGLGQAWPQARNVSAAPGWRVYVFVDNGVKYIQINDSAGTVQAVVATSNGQFLVLPMGAAASRVATSQQQQPLAAVSTTAPGVTVYNDGAVQIKANSQSDGNTSFKLMSNCGAGCNVGQAW